MFIVISYRKSTHHHHFNGYATNTTVSFTLLMDHFFTINKPAMAEFKDRGSTFLAHAYPMETATEFKLLVKEIKKTHPKAAHHCFAYRIGLDGNNFRVSDDREPAGTAGKPILAQIDSRNLTNVLVVVTRYFGGTLLGIPGLINAYRTATALALQLTPTIQKPVEILHKLSYTYINLNEVISIIKLHNCSVLHQDMQLFCNAIIGIPKKNLPAVLYALEQLNDVGVERVETLNN